MLTPKFTELLIQRKPGPHPDSLHEIKATRLPPNPLHGASLKHRCTAQVYMERERDQSRKKLRNSEETWPMQRKTSEELFLILQKRGQKIVK